MHPVSYLFEEIHRDYWGIPQTGQRRKQRRPTTLAGSVAERISLRRARRGA